LIGAAASLAGLAGGPAARGQAPDAKSNPTAEAVLRKTADFFRKAKSVVVDVEREQKVAGFTIKMPVSVALERPNRFAIQSKSDGLASIGMTLVSDGKKMSTAIAQLKRYTEADAPASMDDLQNDPIVKGLFMGMMITELFSTDPYTVMMDGVKTAKYSGSEQIDGVKVHHLSLTRNAFDSEMWIPAEGDPLVKKVKVDLSKSLAKMGGPNGMKNLDMVTTFKNWQVNGPIDAQTFVFKAPEGLKKVDNLFEGLGGAAAAKPETSPLLGQAAPKVNLKLLDGGDFQLQDHRDKQIVMMDFWATWCGPCVQELPILAAVAKAYKDKGVVFRAVNLQEKPEEIREFLKSKKLEITVALDSAGETGGAYGAKAIPMLVLIDKKGVVQSVHVGYSPAIKTTLQKELDALLAGKDLAKEAAAGGATPKPAGDKPRL
jgi:thiol-disulfide isomerase/thioredoxin